MRPPWFEALPALSAHGHEPRPEPTRRHFYWRYRMSADARFAIIRSERSQLPLAFPDINALARWIQRERGDQGLDLVETEDLELEGDLGGKLGVHIYTTDLANDRDRNLGTAWLNGAGLEVLRAALRRNRLVIHEEAA